MTKRLVYLVSSKYGTGSAVFDKPEEVVTLTSALNAMGIDYSIAAEVIDATDPEETPEKWGDNAKGSANLLL